MKLCFPIQEDKDMESVVYSHFGSASYFILLETDTGKISKINNKDLKHEHGKCSPLKALSGSSVDAVIVGGIGKGAINKLNAMGIKIYRAKEVTVKNNLKLFKKGKLPEITLKNACNEHGNCYR
ncbi:NifB/NifX family molybdenum-iron cluster-binding protein [Candidatus Riflebacteria bacterium]